VRGLVTKNGAKKLRATSGRSRPCRLDAVWYGAPPRNHAREKRKEDRMPSTLTVGKSAPDFALKNQDDKTVKLGDFAGKWLVLYFYPKDDTPGCTVEACDFTSGLKDFEKLDAVVLGCSPDSPESHRKFIAKYKLTVGLLSDPEHTVLEKYGAWGEKNLYGKVSMGVLRSTVIIDPEGKVAHHWPKVSAKGHADAVRETLAGLKARK
jgi:peroxiredoxin Q/BCP